MVMSVMGFIITTRNTTLSNGQSFDPVKVVLEPNRDG
jgi:hypothetical protein